MIDYTTVSPDDLEMVRESKRAIFHVLHIPTNTLSQMPVIPGADPVEEARYHSLASLPKGDTRKGVTGFISSLLDDNPVLFKITVRGGNEYLQALATDATALKLTFEGIPKAEPKRKPKEEKPVVEKPAKKERKAKTKKVTIDTPIGPVGMSVIVDEPEVAVADEVVAEVKPQNPAPKPAVKEDDPLDILAELEKLGR